MFFQKLRRGLGFIGNKIKEGTHYLAQKVYDHRGTLGAIAGGLAVAAPAAVALKYAHDRKDVAEEQLHKERADQREYKANNEKKTYEALRHIQGLQHSLKKDTIIQAPGKEIANLKIDLARLRKQMKEQK